MLLAAIFTICVRCLSVGIQSANFFDTMDKMEVRYYLTVSFITAFFCIC